MAGKSLRDRLTVEDCAKYVQIDPRLLPEVFPAEVPKQEKMHPRGGCQGLKVLCGSLIASQGRGLIGCK